MPKHTLSFCELQKCLKQMLDNHLIEVKINNLIVSYDLSKIAFWLTENSRSYHDVKKIPFYGLTEKGGRTWEAVFSPKWEAFSKIESCEHDGNGSCVKHEITIETGSRSYHESLVACLKESINELFLETSITVLEPWQPVYWKTLRKGYMTQFIINDELHELIDNDITQHALWKITIPWRKPSITP